MATSIRYLKRIWTAAGRDKGIVAAVTGKWRCMMAFANKIRLAGKTIGWNVFFSHPEAEALALSQLSLPALLVGVTGPRVPPLLMAIPRQTWKVVCVTGGHDGVKAIVSFYPPSAILLPR